jgi:diguanylate cyclase
MRQPSVSANGALFSRRIYLPRTIGNAFGFLFVAVVLLDKAVPPGIWVVALLHGFVWPHLAYQLARRSADSFEAECRNFYADSFLAGFWVGAMEFNALPSVLFLSIMNMNNIAAGGSRLVVRGFAMQVLGIALSIAALGFSFAPQTSPLQVYACLPMLVIYLLVLGGVTYRLAMQLSHSKQRLHMLSRTDSLTQLPNHGYFNELLHVELQRCQAGGRDSVLALIDIDNFKTINDTQGHLAGDIVLREVSEHLRQGLRTADQPARYGGDEFCVLLPRTKTGEAWELLERLRKSVATLQINSAPQLRISLSIGMAAYSDGMLDTAAWLQATDEALYVAKQRGRDRVVQAAPAAAS